jgi:hypothetical protein
MSNQLQVLIALPQRQIAHGIYCLGNFMGLRADLGAVEDRMFPALPGNELRSSSP